MVGGYEIFEKLYFNSLFYVSNNIVC